MRRRPDGGRPPSAVELRLVGEHDEAWRTGGEPLVVQARRDARQSPPPGSAGLQAAVAAEVPAWELAYQGDFTGASALMQDAAREAGKGADAARGCRAFLLYLAAVWLGHGADAAAEHARAWQLLRDAAAATPRGQWLRETTQLPGQEPQELPAVDQVAVGAVAAVLAGRLNPTKIAAANEQMVQDLSQSERRQYERGLEVLRPPCSARMRPSPGALAAVTRRGCGARRCGRRSRQRASRKAKKRCHCTTSGRPTLSSTSSRTTARLRTHRRAALP